MMSATIREGFRLFAVAALVLALAGCGGGGGSSVGGTAGSGGTTGGGGGGTTVPAAPTSVGAVPGSSQVTLSWAASSGATSYNIYWSTAAGVSPASGTKIAGVSSPYVQTGLTNGTTYYYVVTAVNAAGESAPSTQVSATPAAAVSASYTIGGYLVGLAAGQSVVLQDNGGDNLTVSANGTFTFSTPLAANTNYNVTVLTQPANGQVCGIVNNATLASASSGVGVVTTSNIDTVRVACGSVFTFAGSGVAGKGDTVGEEAVFHGPSGAAFDSAGNLYVADATSDVIRKITPAGAVSTLAGSGLRGYTDATGELAQFKFTATAHAGLAVDSSGNVYVADTGNNVIRMITPAGVVSTLAGSGTAGYVDATGTAAQFSGPQAVAVDASGNVYVADTGNSMIREIAAGGAVTTLAGSLYAGNTDGVGTNASFLYPAGIALDGKGNAYIGDTGNNGIRKIVLSTATVTTVAGQTGTWVGGYVDATGTAAQFNAPMGVSVDGAGNIYVADSGNYLVRMVTPAGVVSTVGGSVAGSADGVATAAQFNLVQDVAATAAGDVYVTDRTSNKVRKISAAPFGYKVSGHLVGLLPGQSIVLQNNGADNLTLTADGSFTFPTPLNSSQTYSASILTQPAGQTCVMANPTGSFAGSDPWTIMVTCDTVSTYAGSGTAGYTDSTNPLTAQFKFSTSTATAPQVGMVVDPVSGNMYVSDPYNERIRQITPAGVVSTLAGSGQCTNVDGTGTKASFCGPAGLAVDSSGNIYVADSVNGLIRKVTPTGVVTTIAGNIYGGFADGTGTAAAFNGPSDVAIDSAGNLYVADSGNQAIRKITPAGVVTTIAGAPPTTPQIGFLNGMGTNSRFAYPTGIAIDAAGNLYVADKQNGAVRKITPAGMVSTLAGPKQVKSWTTVKAGYVNSTGVSAKFNGPTSLVVDAAGNVYVADAADNVIRRISPSGTVTTMAGPAAPAKTAGLTNGNGASALFNDPNGIAYDAVSASLYVADTLNNVIRKITP